MALRLPAVSGTCRDDCRFILYAPTSITVSRKRGRHSDKSESRSGSIAAKFSTLKPRWLVVRVRIRLTKRVLVNASVARVLAGNVKADRTAEDREATTSRRLPIGNCRLPIYGPAACSNRKLAIGNWK